MCRMPNVKWLPWVGPIPMISHASPGKEQSFTMIKTGNRAGRPLFIEPVEERTHRGSHSLVRVHYRTPQLIPHVAGGYRPPQLAAAGTTPSRSVQPSIEDRNFRLRKNSFDPEHKMVIRVTGIIDSGLIGNERPGQGTHLK